jgi:hypothetical protein
MLPLEFPVMRCYYYLLILCVFVGGALLTLVTGGSMGGGGGLPGCTCVGAVRSLLAQTELSSGGGEKPPSDTWLNRKIFVIIAGYAPVEFLAPQPFLTSDQTGTSLFLSRLTALQGDGGVIQRW